MWMAVFVLALHFVDVEGVRGVKISAKILRKVGKLDLKVLNEASRRVRVFSGKNQCQIF